MLSVCYVCNWPTFPKHRILIKPLQRYIHSECKNKLCQIQNCVYVAQTTNCLLCQKTVHTFCKSHSVDVKCKNCADLNRCIECLAVFKNLDINCYCQNYVCHTCMINSHICANIYLKIKDLIAPLLYQDCSSIVLSYIYPDFQLKMTVEREFIPWRKNDLDYPRSSYSFTVRQLVNSSCKIVQRKKGFKVLKFYHKEFYNNLTKTHLQEKKGNKGECARWVRSALPSVEHLWLCYRVMTYNDNFKLYFDVKAFRNELQKKTKEE